MNYYNPYFYTIPNIASAPRVGFLGRIFGRTGITISNILNGTQRALNFANQAIPLVKQVRPMIGNAKTMFKVMNEFKRAEKPIRSNTTNNNITKENIVNEAAEEIKLTNNSNNNGPTFFI